MWSASQQCGDRTAQHNCQLMEHKPIPSLSPACSTACCLQLPFFNVPSPSKPRPLIALHYILLRASEKMYQRSQLFINSPFIKPLMSFILPFISAASCIIKHKHTHTHTAHNLSCLWCAEYIIHQEEPIIWSHCATLASNVDRHSVDSACHIH